MPVIYAARSQSLETWAAEVGLTKTVAKIGVADDAAAAVAALNAENHAGANDWKMLKKVKTDVADEVAIIERLAKRETAVDPKYYPRLRGAVGIFKVKPANVQNYMMVKAALAGGQAAAVKIKPAVIAEYLLENAIE